MEKSFIVIGFVLVGILIKIVVDGALGVSKALKPLPRWKIMAHETLHMIFGMLLCALMLSL